MKKFRQGTALLLILMLLLQCMCIAAAAADAPFTDVTVTTSVRTQRITVAGKSADGLQRDITLLLKKNENVIHTDQFQSEADGSFRYVIAASFAAGDTFSLQLGGGGVAEPYRTEFTVPYDLSAITDVTASAEAGGTVRFSGALAERPAGVPVSAVLETATGRRLWSGSAAVGADGTFSGEITGLTLAAGDAMVLRLSAERAEGSTELIVVPTPAQPEKGSITQLTITPDTANQRFAVSGLAEPAAARELTVLVTKGGNTIYLNQFMTDADGEFALTVPAAMAAGDTFRFQFNGVTLTERVVREVTIADTSLAQFSGVSASVDPAGSVAFSGTLAGHPGASVLAVLKNAAGTELWSGSVTADETGAFTGAAAGLTFAAGDALTLTLSAEGAQPHAELLVVPTAPPVKARITAMTVTYDLTAQKFTVRGSTEPAAQRQLSLLVTLGGAVKYLDQISTAANGAFETTFPADMKEGDVFTFRLNGADLSEGAAREVTIVDTTVYHFSGVSAVIGADGAISFSGTLAGRPNAAVSAALETATGRPLWSGSLTADGNGAFAGAITGLTFAGGDALMLRLSSPKAETTEELLVVPTASQPEKGSITQLTITPDVSEQSFSVAGRTEPAGARELTILVTKAGNTVYVNQFMTGADGVFTLKVPAAMAAGDTFLFQFNGVTLTEGAKRTVVIPESRFGGVQASAGAGSGKLAFSGRLENRPRTQVGAVLRDAAGRELWRGTVTTDENGAFADEISGLTLTPGAGLTLTLSADNAEVYSGSITVSGGGGSGGSGGSGGGSGGGSSSGGGTSTQTVTHYSYLSGYPDGTFRPSGRMTRAEAAAVFARLHADQYQFSGSDASSFPDVPAGAWYAPAVGRAQSLGIVNGTPGGRFLPGANITRAQFAAMLVRSAGASAGGEAGFPDVAANHWAAGYIGCAVKNGWVSGYPDGTFRPEQYVTRAEAVAMIHRMLGRTCTREFVAQQTSWRAYSDVPASHWAYTEIMCDSNTHSHVS